MAHADTPFIVNTTGDQNDLDFPAGTLDGTSDGVCDVSAASGEQCTLRAAIQEANAISGGDIINFNIPVATATRCASASGVCTISPNEELPEITQALTIDGYTQSDASPNTRQEGNNAKLKIELNGARAGDFAAGIPIDGTATSNASNCVVRGLIINRFGDDGVQLTQDSNEVTSNNTIEGNFIGTDASGKVDLGNKSDGVDLNHSPDNVVGGTSPADRNLISGNGGNGVIIQGAADEATGNSLLAAWNLFMCKARRGSTWKPRGFSSSP